MLFKTVAFHELSLNELHDLLKLRTDTFVVEQACAYPEIDGNDPKCFHTLGTDSGGVLRAVARIVPEGVNGKQLSIGRVVVEPSARGRGAGRKLMEEAISFCESKWGKTTVKVAAQLYLKEFYRDLGFVPTGDVYPWDGIDHIDMLREAKD